MTVYYADDSVTLHHGDALVVSCTLPDGSADCIVTSPPYFGLRDYGVDGQYGLESSPTEYVEVMRALFSELRRVLADDGTLWLNIGDSYVRNPKKGTTGAMNGRNVPRMGYAGDQIGHPDLPEKNLLGIPWRYASVAGGVRLAERRLDAPQRHHLAQAKHDAAIGGGPVCEPA